MKLTYRGINYKSQNAEETKFHLADKNQDRVILVRPIHYYTYRGVSYTKNLTYDGKTKALLDINRQ